MESQDWKKIWSKGEELWSSNQNQIPQKNGKCDGDSWFEILNVVKGFILESDLFTDEIKKKFTELNTLEDLMKKNDSVKDHKVEKSRAADILSNKQIEICDQITNEQALINLLVAKSFLLQNSLSECSTKPIIFDQIKSCFTEKIVNTGN